ncbi:MAG: lipoyl synthase [Thermoanaerobaculum sp.]|nr:lipoyl synthase [Thermoanaerobaculum sp.]MDW7968632.1 lipoyl synthase [Thermoanaerobaculum sp.]
MRERLPAWIAERKLTLPSLREVRRIMTAGQLHTVCDEARCPNRSECFSRGTATFLIMGDRCTRSCRYCSIAHGRPRPLDPEEPQRLAQAARELKLRHVVVTSVDRDDLPDGGAGHFARVIAALRELQPPVTVEVLTPDFRGQVSAVDTVIAAGPHVYNHNVETVPRLYPQVRRQGRYTWALSVLSRVAEKAPHMVRKSGLMVGLGETRQEVEGVLRDLKAVDCQIVTVGQYLQPTSKQVPVVRYWHPEEFRQLEEFGAALGLEVIAGPFVRSSYRAEEAFLKVT